MNIKSAESIIKQRRKLLGIDQRELSRIAGISIHALSNLESGAGNPTLATLSKVLDALGLEMKIKPKEPGIDPGHESGTPS